ncbi:MAG TPA: BREX system ATP-binding domain-containing protein, partial [Candidatus Limnocylindrales bacterium]
MVGRILSPLVVGRDDFLDLADRRLGEVKAGQGQLLLLSGEAGIGKTRLLTAIRDMARGLDFATAEGAVLPEDRNVPAASFLDLARNLQRRREFGTLGTDVLAAIRDVPGVGGPARRAIVRDTVDLVIAAVSKPMLFVFEDLHWADDLSLELLAELARATRDRPILLVGSYRTEEAGPGTSLRAWRSRLVTQRTAEELRLGRLSLAETSLLITLILGRTLPTPRDVALAVHQRTDGVPLFVEELLAALGPAAADRRTIAEADVPETVQDATLQRVARLSPQARAIAGAGAVIGRRFSLDVLAHILDQPVDDLVDPLQELVDTGILDAAPGRDLYDFHHQVLRDALYGALPARDRKRLHAQAARFGPSLEGIGDTDASAHFEHAGMAAEAFHAATAAARNAVRLASHREAEELYRRAIRNLPPDLDAAAAAAVHEDHGRELAAIDDNEGASAAFLEARRLYQISGQALPAAAILASLAMVRHLLGDGVGVVEPLLRGGLAEIDALPASDERRRTRARLVAALAYAIGIAFRVEDAEPLAREALALAIETGDDRTHIAALTTIGGLLVPFKGRIAEGFAYMDEAIALARAGGYDDELARTLRVTGAMASEVLDYARSERYLREGIEFSDRRQLGTHL